MRRIPTTEAGFLCRRIGQQAIEQQLGEARRSLQVMRESGFIPVEKPTPKMTVFTQMLNWITGRTRR